MLSFAEEVKTLSDFQLHFIERELRQQKADTDYYMLRGIVVDKLRVVTAELNRREKENINSRR